MANKNDSVLRTFAVVVALCLVCSICVAGTAVSLRGIQEDAKALDKQTNIVIVSSLPFDADKDDPRKIYADKIEAQMIDMQTGAVKSDYDSAKSAAFDYVAESKGTHKHEISKDMDKAGIRFRSDIMPVYVAKDNGKVVSYILPFYGQGLWSTLYGFIAVSPDGKTVKGINFYDHGETPGLGGEISNPKWTKLWIGKEIFKDGKLALKVTKGPAPQGDKNLVDGISGATLTGDGVNGCVAYWLSADGYAPFLKTLSGE